MRSPSSESYTTFWRMTIYRDTLHWWDITPIFGPLLILTVLPILTFYLIVWGFHRTFAMDAAWQQRTLTPPDTWSCTTFGLACVLMSRPELVLFPDFWISNIPRYFLFASFACVLMSRPISPELVLFPDFWALNTHRYFCFATTLNSV